MYYVISFLKITFDIEVDLCITLEHVMSFTNYV